MPVYDIQTPGGKVLTIEAPDEATALSGAQQWHAENSGPTDAPSASGGNAVSDWLNTPPKQDWGLSDAIVNGITFGTAPNIAGAGRATADTITDALGITDTGRSFGENYDRHTAAAQDERRAYEQEHPYRNLAGNAVGGVMTGGTLAKGGLSLTGKALEQGAGRLATTAASAAEGAGYGFAAGFGGGEGGFENRLEGGLEGAKGGAVVGALTPAAVAGVSKLGGTVKNWWTGLRNPELQGERLLVQRLMQSGDTPEGVAARVQAGQDMGLPDYVALDAAPKNVQKLGGVAIRSPSEFRDTGTEFLAKRAQGQPDRLQTHLDKALGQGDSAFSTEQSLIASRKSAAGPLYDAAYAEPAPNGAVFSASLTKPSVQRAMTGAEGVAAEKQLPITDLFTDVAGPDGTTTRTPTMRGWDYIKRELDAEVNRLYKAGDTTAAEAVKETRNALREAMSRDADGNLTNYGKALQTYADDTSSLEAIQTGRDVAKAANPDAALADFASLSPEEQILARLGASREMGVKLDNSRPGVGNVNALTTPNNTRKLDALVPDQTARTILADRLAREKDMARVGNDMLGGSQTAERMGDASNVDTGGLVSAIATNRWLTAAGRVLDPLMRAGYGLREPGANRVGELLISRDPQAMMQLADLFKQMQTASQPSPLVPAMVLGGVNAPRQNFGREKQ